MGAQTAADLDRFAAMGVTPQRLTLVGNIKFDRVLPADIHERGAQWRAYYAEAVRCGSRAARIRTRRRSCWRRTARCEWASRARC